MANQGLGISHSPISRTSDDESHDNTSRGLATQPGRTSLALGGGTMSLTKNEPSKSSTPPGYSILGGSSGGNDIGNDHINHNLNFPPPKKHRGRPRGSKNKPKPPITIIREVDDKALKPVIIEISAGSDVVEELIYFAQRHEMGLTVLSGSGSVTNVTLHQPFPHTSPLTLHGTFTLLSLSGTYILRNQGQVFGGVIAGRIIATSSVVVVATLCKNLVHHKLPHNNGSDDVVAADVFNARSFKNNANEIGGGMNTSNAIMATSAAALNAASASPLNFHVPSDANVNVMQWGFPNHSHNY
ncbi:AT-hook motif nuclear-localized protein 28-like [Senna tora]|uniref:AT-hook motif nuclear-localized protein 28-like n=1 Tax=Senna tora TaxID=362788 RepID=A0A834U2R7_9FABA|nr:AT-hook motif nuclear-localized protein 28-like [Senna tora]